MLSAAAAGAAPICSEFKPAPTRAHGALCLQQTFEFHYGKHHAAYLNNLNGQVAGKELANAASVHEVRAWGWQSCGAGAQP